MKTAMTKLPLLVGVGAVLLVGMGAGLLRLGWAVPGIGAGAVTAHGPLMIGGVLGTLISLERVVALSAHDPNSRLGYLAPVLTISGAVLLVFGSAGMVPKLLITLGSLGLIALFAVLVRKHIAPFTVVMMAGAGCWFVGNGLWLLGQPVYQVIHWWVAFLVLTIVGERLELSRVLRLTQRAQGLFAVATAVFFAGVILTIGQLGLGIRLAGVGEVLLALWLLRYDMARRTVRREGLPRFIALCLLVGYVWLGTGGVFGLLFGAVRAGVQYELLLHALLLGFVFSMIFGHALIIIPALAQRNVGFHAGFYLPLILLHGSLLLRVWGGLTTSMAVRQWGGMLNVIAIFSFMGMIVISVLRERQQASRSVPIGYIKL
jgi:hypothetical protein